MSKSTTPATETTAMSKYTIYQHISHQTMWVGEANSSKEAMERFHSLFDKDEHFDTNDYFIVADEDDDLD